MLVRQRESCLSSGIHCMVRLEKIKYKPVPVRDLLVEMKDLSELMIDLAYSAALFNSHPLAEEVLELEKRVDTLAYILDMNAMIAARDAKDAESLVGVSVVAAATDKISDAAGDIAVLVLKEIGVHPIVREAFEKVEERLTRVTISPHSVLVGKRIGELKLATTMGVDIIALRREKELKVNPEAAEKLHAGDIIVARGAPLGVEQLEKLAEGTLRELES